MNYLRNSGYEVFGRNPKKSFVAFKYDKNDKLIIKSRWELDELQ